MSFDDLDREGGRADVGGLSLRLEGDAQSVEGRAGRAIAFGDEGGRLVVEGFALDSPRLTVQAWVKPTTDQPKWATVVDYWARSHGFWLGGSIAPGGWEFWTDSSRTGFDRGLVVGEWQHLAGVLDAPATSPGGKADGEGPSLRFYVNGLLLDVVSGAGGYSKPAISDLFIGSRGDLSDFFRGVIDEVQVWTEARTAEQICADAGGTWSDGACRYDAPVGQPPTPCEGVTCSGHGRCVLADAQATCACDPGYIAWGSTECVPEPSACDGIEDKIVEWVDWQRRSIPTGLEEEARKFLDEYTPGNSAWNPEAEAWTVLGQTGLWQNAMEVACLGFLMAVQADPENPVALNNAATCMFLQGYGGDARRFADCSLKHAPDNASAVAAQAYHELHDNADPEAALERYEEAARLDPSNPEWRYQALQLAVKKGDLARANAHLAEMPAGSAASPGGYRGTKPPADPLVGGLFCCPCGTPATYSTFAACVSQCSADLSCFVGLCAFTGTCEATGFPFSFGLKFCVPPSGLQACFTVDTQGNIGAQLGFSVFNGMLGVGAGFQYNLVNKKVNFVAEAGTNKLPINGGTSWTVDLSNGRVAGAVGLSDRSGGHTLQTTVVGD